MGEVPEGRRGCPLNPAAPSQSRRKPCQLSHGESQDAELLPRPALAVGDKGSGGQGGEEHDAAHHQLDGTVVPGLGGGLRIHGGVLGIEGDAAIRFRNETLSRAVVIPGIASSNLYGRQGNGCLIGALSGAVCRGDLREGAVAGGLEFVADRADLIAEFFFNLFFNY